MREGVWREDVGQWRERSAQRLRDDRPGIHVAHGVPVRENASRRASRRAEVDRSVEKVERDRRCVLWILRQQKTLRRLRPYSSSGAGT